MRKSKILQALLISLLLGLTTVALADRFAGKSYHATYEECRDSFIHYYASEKWFDTEAHAEEIRMCQSIMRGWPFPSSLEYQNGTKEYITYDPSTHFCYGSCPSWTQYLRLPQIVYNVVLLGVIYFSLTLVILLMLHLRRHKLVK